MFVANTAVQSIMKSLRATNQRPAIIVANGVMERMYHPKSERQNTLPTTTLATIAISFTTLN